MVNIKTVIL